ncbi:hypothetical protein GCM10023331_00100 [Algivirga pacifica]|uniref:Uncharacterized protein n=2 Tax=Algivirga pacifica TaxID=1162670 RepID=A0ABP9CV00_9BACT
MEDTDRAASTINQLYAYTLNMAHYGEQFLAYETTNEHFFKTGSSDILNQQFSYLKKVKKLSTDIQSSKGKWKHSYQTELVQFDQLIATYERTYTEIIKSIKYKGFMDYGLLGHMKEQINYLEESSYINKEYLLLMQHQEKEYLIRGNKEHLYNTRSYAARIKRELNQNPNISMGEKIRLTEHLRRYNSAFLQVVEEDLKVGYKMNKGLVPRIQQLTKDIGHLVTAINEQAKSKKNDLYDKARVGVVTATTISVILLLILSVSFNIILKR